MAKIFLENREGINGKAQSDIRCMEESQPYNNIIEGRNTNVRVCPVKTWSRKSAVAQHYNRS